MATVNKGDEVIIPAPYWVSYPDIILLAGGKPKIVKCDEKDNFKLTAQNLKKAISKKTKLKSDTEFVQKLLEKANVAVVQGSAFGLPGYFRISYATSMENLKKAMERIKNFCEDL